MNMAQAFWCDIRDQETFAYRFLRESILSIFNAFLARHAHLFLKLTVLLLEQLVLLIVVIEEWLHSEAKWVALVGSWSSDKSHV